ncbi:hypothetical protein PLICRDRAFT_174635 [Plicaturopsis crispa FD-325 SS-3]|nr:hypothetical protein PLICRDRAFT_174635 [Plicaturopsis crispa FD-325 SS-3]
MPVDIPPGPKYVASQLPRLLLPPIATYAVLTLLHPAPPLWLSVLAPLLSLPALLALGVWWEEWCNRRAARKLGAVLPPRIRGTGLAGRKICKRLVENSVSGYIAEVFSGWAEEYGHTARFGVMFEDRVFTTEPEHIKAILATQFDVFDKGPVVNAQFDSLLGTGVFNSDGAIFHRSMTRPFFSKDRIAHFDIFDEHAEHTVRLLRQRLREGWPIDIQDAVSRFTLDSATHFLFGHNVNSLSAGLPYPSSSLLPSSPDHLNNPAHPANAFAHAFAEAQSIASLRSRRGPAWALSEFWEDKVKVQMKVVDGFIEPIVEEAISKKRAEGGAKYSGADAQAREVAEGETLLDHLVNYTEDKKIIMDETMNIMIAGRDTTATTLTFAIYMLAENPQYLTRLRAEILEHIGPDQRPSYDDLRRMKFMRAVINETLRLYPAVPMNSRTAMRPTVWQPTATSRSSQPYYIPAKTRAAYSVFLTHRRTDLWGPDAEDFDPDRWLDARVARVTKNPFMFTPFNAGPRICLGQQFAYNEMSFMLVRFFQAFAGVKLTPEAIPVESRPPEEWKASNGPQAKEKVWPRSHLTMYANGGLWVSLEEANVA